MKALVLLLAGCSTELILPDGPPPADMCLSVPDLRPEAPGERGSGHVAPGFFQRGCQWDACDPPPERERNQGTNPGEK